jgi:hypothetical protein
MTRRGWLTGYLLVGVVVPGDFRSFLSGGVTTRHPTFGFDQRPELL